MTTTLKISFIGLGKLGMPCAEAIAKKGIDVTGFDITNKKSDLISIKSSIEDTVKDRDIIFIAVPTPHEAGYAVSYTHLTLPTTSRV